MIEKIIDKILENLKGFDFWFVLLMLAIAIASWYWIGAKITEHEKLYRQFVMVLGVIITASVWIAIHHICFSKDYTFPKGVAGILVLRINGDDANHSLQTDLVSSLNTELSKESPTQRIEVRAGEQAIDEGLGLAQAHGEARKLGRKLGALLLVWGNRVGEKKFHARITTGQTPLKGERALDVQNICELSLPAELVDKPIYIAHFITGYSFYDRKQYAEALAHFQLALGSKTASAADLADLKSYVGTCHLHLAQGQKKMATHLRSAIVYFQELAGYYQTNNFPRAWAIMQNNIGRAFGDLPTGDRTANLQKAIAAFEAALCVYTKKDFPAAWAGMQNNIGRAYVQLPTGDRTANLQKAMTAFEAALSVYTETDFSTDWAMTQNNLGAAYVQLPTGDRMANLQKAMTAFEAALRVRTEKDFPIEWANTQINLGNVYTLLPTWDQESNFQKAIVAFETTLRVRTEKDFPVEWAATQNNLGKVYIQLATMDNEANQLSFRGKTYRRFLPPEEKTKYFQKALAAYEAALRVYTETDFPEDWANTQNNLGLAYALMPTGDCVADLTIAKACCEKALRIFTPDSSPDNYQLSRELLDLLQGQLKIIHSEDTSRKSALIPRPIP